MVGAGAVFNLAISLPATAFFLTTDLAAPGRSVDALGDGVVLLGGAVIACALCRARGGALVGPRARRGVTQIVRPLPRRDCPLLVAAELNWRLGKAAELCLSSSCAGPGVRAQHDIEDCAYGEASLNRFLSKDFLSGVMFIAFGITALYFGNHLALGTPVRMGPGYVPHKLACIMLVLGGIIALVPLFETASRREKEAVWIPVCVAAVLFIPAVHYLPPLFGTPSPWLVALSADWFQLIATALLLALLLLCALAPIFGGARAAPGTQVEQVEPPKWKPITMVTIGIVVFALLFETTGMFPSLVALVLIASWGGDEFKLWEVIGNIVVLTILCVVVFKIGLSMNIAVINGVW
jgi:hypothetical protein